MNGLGSSTPPGGHHGDDVVASWNTGDEGVMVSAVATARHWKPVKPACPAGDASYHITQWPPICATPGEVWVLACCQMGTTGSAVEP